MFTGLIEDVGRVTAVGETTGGRRLTVESRLAGELSVGDSIAVNGVCLTVVDRSSTALSADVSPATLRVTTLGEWAAGRRVNLERPLRAEDRLGGHFVLGHVDAVTRLEAVRADGESWWMDFRVPEAFETCLISKGSIAVDGISLTVAALSGRTFGVQVIPHTWAHTALSDVAPGQAVNIEVDVLGKYVARIMENQSVGGPVGAWRDE